MAIKVEWGKKYPWMVRASGTVTVRKIRYKVTMRQPMHSAYDEPTHSVVESYATINRADGRGGDVSLSARKAIINDVVMALKDNWTPPGTKRNAPKYRAGQQKKAKTRARRETSRQWSSTNDGLTGWGGASNATIRRLLLDELKSNAGDPEALELINADLKLVNRRIALAKKKTTGTKRITLAKKKRKKGTRYTSPISGCTNVIPNVALGSLWRQAPSQVFEGERLPGHWHAQFGPTSVSVLKSGKRYAWEVRRGTRRVAGGGAGSLALAKRAAERKA